MARWLKRGLPYKVNLSKRMFQKSELKVTKVHDQRVGRIVVELPKVAIRVLDDWIHNKKCDQIVNYSYKRVISYWRIDE